jgi:membrane protease YdiL (CAAX protease family)
MSPQLLHGMLLLLTLQQKAEPSAEEIQITPGQTLSLLLLLPLLGLSIVVGIKWLVSILNHQHPLPDAGRGLPHIPRMLTGVTIIISLLQMLAVWSAAIAPADSIPPGTGAAVTNGADGTEGASETGRADESGGAADGDTAGGKDAAEESETAGGTGEEAPVALDEKTRRQAWNVLVASLLMNLVICIPMAIVVMRCSSQGRVPVSSPGSVEDVPRTAISSDTGWADLDADEFGIPGQSVVSEQPERVLSADMSSVPSAAHQPRLWPAPVSFVREFRFAVEVMLAAWFPTMLLRFLLVLTMQAVTGEEAPSNPLLEMITGGAAGGLLAMIIFLGIVMAPLAEELQFRVVLLGGLLQASSRWLALTVSSVTFSLLHGLPDGFALLPLAFALGYAFERRQSYVTVVFIHFLFNSLNLGVALLAGS